MKKILSLLIFTLTLITFVNAQSPEYYMSKKGYKNSLIEKNYGMVNNVLKSYSFKYNTSADVYELTKGQWIYQIRVKVKKNEDVVMVFFATPQGFDNKYSVKKSRMPIFNALWEQVEFGLEEDIIRPTNSGPLHNWQRDKKYMKDGFVRQ